MALRTPPRDFSFRWILVLCCALTATGVRGGNLAQSISWGTLPQSHLILNRSYPLEVSASSGLPVSVSVQSGPAVIANGTLTATNFGLIELRADQPGDDTYASMSWGLQLNHTKVELTQMARLPELTNAFDVSLSPDGTLALVSSGRDGVAVVDLRDPAAPQIRSVIRSAGEFAYSRRAKVVGTLAYVLVNTVGLEVWDLQDADHPVLVGSTAAGNAATDLAVANGMAYLVGDLGTGLRIVDLRDSMKPVEVGHLAMTESPLCVTASGEHVLVGCFGGPLLIINVARPNQPAVAGRFELGASLVAIQPMGNMAICAVEGRWLAAVDWGVPTAPTLLGKSAIWPVQDVALGDGVAFVANAEGWIDAFDTVSPGWFLGEGRLPLPVQFPGVFQQDLSVARHQDVVCVAGSLQGVVVVHTRRGMSQLITTSLPESLRVDSSPFPLDLTLSSELPATVRLVEGPATLNDGTLTLTGSGTIHLRVEQAGNAQFLPLAQDIFISVLKLAQSIGWSAPATNTPLRLNEPTPLVATASSGLPIQFRVKSGPAVIENGIARATNFGRIVLVAEQPGDDRHLPVSEERTFNQPAAITTPVGRWPRHEFTNNVSAVAAYGQFALVGNRTGMQVLDLSRPADPVEVGSLGGGAVTGIEVSGQTAWLTFAQEARAVDLSDPQHPVYTARLAPAQPISFVSAVGVSGPAAYLAGNDFEVFDLSNPNAPESKGTVDLPGYKYAVRVVGTHAFVATGSGLQILNLSNPMSPSLVGAAAGWNCRDVWVEGDRAFIALGNAGLAVFNVSNPAEPQLLGRLDTAGEALAVRVVGNVAYVADGTPGVQIIDVSNPSSLKLRSPLDTPGFARGLALNDGSLLIADGTAGMQIIDVSAPGGPVRVGGFNLGTAYAVKLVGQTAYLANGASGLELLDITNPREPRLIGKFDSKGTASDVEIVGSRAFLADGSAGLVALDLTDPTEPASIGEVDTTGNASHLRVVGNRAYVADGTAGLQIIDVTNPAAPRLLGRYATQGYARRVEVVGESVYIADTSRGLLLVRVTNPASPTLIQRWPVNPPQQMSGVWAADNTVYATDGYLWTRSPLTSTLGRSRALGGVDVVAQGSRAYTAAGDSGFRVIDVSEPTDAFVLGTFALGAYAQSIRTAGDLAFVANDRAGLKIQRIREGVPQVLEFEPATQLGLTNPLVTLEATASSGLPVTFEQVSGPAFLVGNQLTVTNAGTVVVRARQAGDEQFLPAFLDRTITASWVGQSLDWGSLTNELLKLDEPHALRPTASSGLPVVARVVAGPAQIVAGQLVVTNRGTVSVSIEQLGGAGYLPTESRRLFNLEGMAFTKIGTWPPLPRGYATDVAVVNGRAFVTRREGGFTVWNVNQPEVPEFVGFFRQGLGSAAAITVTNELAYLTSSTDGLQIVDVSDPSNLRLLGQVAVHHNGVDLQVVNGLAYVASWDAGIHLVNVADPAAPMVIGHLATPSYANSVAVEDSVACVAASGAGLLIVDVSNPAAPVQVGQFSTAGWANHARVEGGIIYVVDTVGGLSLVDVTDPAAPRLLGNLPLEGVGRSVWVENGRVQVTTDDGMVLLIDAADPRQPRLLGRLEAARNGVALQGVGPRTYVAAGDDGIRIVDMTDPARPSLVTSFAEGGSASDVKAAGGFAFLADRGGGFRVLDLSNPAKPSEVAHLETAGTPSRIGVADGRALISAETGGFQVVDISQPRRPRLLATFNETGDNRAAAPAGQFVALANGSSGLQLVDLSGIPEIRPRGQAPVAGFAWDVEVGNQLAFVAADGLDIFSLSAEAVPSLLAHFDIPGGRANQIRQQNGLLILASDTAGVSFVDIADPVRPRLLGTQAGHQAFGVEPMDHSRVLVADGYGGVRAVDFTDPTLPAACGRFSESTPARAVAVTGELVLVAADAELQVLRWREGTVQRITFSLPEAVSLGQGLLPLHAEANSGLPVTLSVVSGPATMAGFDLVLTGGGSVVVRAEQAGDGSFLPAEPVERTIMVTVPPKIRPETIRWLAPDRLEFRLTVVPGQSYTVYASADLVTWEEVLTKVASEADEVFTDTTANSNRYYRATPQ